MYCGEPDCGSFYTIQPPDYTDELDVVEGFIVQDGSIVVEVIEGKVGFVEVLPSNEGNKIGNEIRKYFK